MQWLDSGRPGGTVSIVLDSGSPHCDHVRPPTTQGDVAPTGRIVLIVEAVNDS
jgi:hypothetical protein